MFPCQSRLKCDGCRCFRSESVTRLLSLGARVGGHVGLYSMLRPWTRAPSIRLARFKTSDGNHQIWFETTEGHHL
jgi:hypothetical protein